MPQSPPRRVWTIEEAIENLPEILRLAEEDGPQRIGDTKIFTLAPESEQPSEKPDRIPMGQWLVKNMPRGVNLEIPDGRVVRPSDQFHLLTKRTND